jgi:NADPH:quinone reductase-like Zn-dependent oxidoreductase
MIIRLGKKLGFRTINVIRREDQRAALLALGADHVVVAPDGNFVDAVQEITKGSLRYALDPVGGVVGESALHCLSAGGTLVLYGLLSGEAVRVDPRFVITGSKSVHGFWLADWAGQASVLKKLRMLRRVSRLVADGTLATETGQIYAITQIADAVQEAERPGHPGKVLLRLGK